MAIGDDYITTCCLGNRSNRRGTQYSPYQYLAQKGKKTKNPRDLEAVKCKSFSTKSLYLHNLAGEYKCPYVPTADARNSTSDNYKSMFIPIYPLGNKKFLENEKTKESTVDNGKGEKKVISPAKEKKSPLYPYKDKEITQEETKKE